MKNLFKIETYKGAKVNRTDSNTLTVDWVKGHKNLRVVFSRVVSEWEVKVRVSAYMTDEPPPNHVNLMSGAVATSDIKEFWAELNQMAFESQNEGMEERCDRVIAIIEARESKPKKKGS